MAKVVSMSLIRGLSSLLIVPVLALGAGKALALEVNIAEYLPYVEVKNGSQSVRIMRIQDQDHRLTGGFAKTSRPCPPFCFQPMEVSPQVKTVGELELVRFIASQIKDTTGMLVDARTPEWYMSGTIPGSVNVPFTIFDGVLEASAGKGDGNSPDNVHLAQALKLFGVRPKSAQDEANFLVKLFIGEASKSPWDFSNAKTLLLFCNGPWCEQSPRAIRGLMALGYPPSKLLYYRGGMQMWQLGGFTTVVPETGG